MEVQGWEYKIERHSVELNDDEDLENAQDCLNDGGCEVDRYSCRRPERAGPFAVGDGPCRRQLITTGTRHFQCLCLATCDCSSSTMMLPPSMP